MTLLFTLFILFNFLNNIIYCSVICVSNPDMILKLINLSTSLKYFSQHIMIRD